MFIEKIDGTPGQSTNCKIDTSWQIYDYLIECWLVYWRYIIYIYI
jgi:hypothetical protein